jgi:signal transduction histidine kinase
VTEKDSPRIEIAAAAAREERKRISRELHDRVLQQLSGIRLRAEACRQKFLSNPVTLAKELEAMERSVDHVIAEIRGLLADSQTETELVAGSLERRLREEIEIFCARSGLKLKFQCHMAPNRLPHEVERELYFALREGVINAIRHSRASELALSLSQSGQRCIATLKDNGIGFDPGLSEATGHYGLRGMHQRIEKIGGRLQINSAPGQGTLIRMTVDIDEKT